MKEKYANFKAGIHSRLLVALMDGTLKGLKTAVMLLKIMIPVYLIVVLIKYSPVMPWLQDIFSPVMKIFNLPSEAVVAVVSGFFTDEYGVVAALSGFDFTMAEITTVAMINLTMHSIPVESAIARKIGLPAGKFFAFRVCMAVLVGIMIGWMGGVLL
ncbi:MAG: hypothetical protein K6F52_06140 [Clostridia bacterium]|nr:hypothetical protein [Clostridia bacterium]